MKIAMIQVVIPTYKVRLFSELTSKVGIDFYVGDKNNSAVGPNADDLSFVKGRLKNHFVKFLGIDWLYQSGFSLKKIRKYDLIIIPISVPFFLNYKILFLAKIFGVKVGMYGMGINYQKRFDNQSRLLEFLRVFLYKSTVFSIVYTESIKKILVEKSKLNAEKIFVAPNTLDVSHLDNQHIIESDFRNELGIKPNQVIITFVGRISPQKSPGMLLNVIKELTVLGYDPHLIYIGSGELSEELKNKVSIMGNVSFLGQQTEEVATEILKGSDFSIMPGLTGLAVVHSFICKTVYITVESTLHSPEVEYIENGVNGFIVPNTPIDIAAKVAELIENKSLKQKIEENAYSYVQNNLSLEAQFQGFVNALSSI